MISIESTTEPVRKSSQEVFDFLKDMRHHEKLMPSQVSEWWSEHEEAKLKIQGLGALHLRRDEMITPSFIKIVPASKPPVDLNLEWNITPSGENCEVKVVIHADLNMFMKMVAEKPLKNLADFMAGKVESAMISE